MGPATASDALRLRLFSRLASAYNSTYTTESNEYPATSEYSSATNSTSDYPAHFEFVSQLNAIDPKRTIFSDPPMFFDSSGLQLSPSLFPTLAWPRRSLTMASMDYPLAYLRTFFPPPFRALHRIRRTPPSALCRPKKPHGSHQGEIHMP
ncbi:hypothetical protein EDB92DRAFT_1956028 [Lactarius akahatsu]|uniref:Uncharacterized protein n=1 Tax=Lactarius akahatsu TaxID=416441 RepID=A0AAD4L7Y6_9AGAM|nr:hypothetical protein EDB92DRAFT_1956028 [Lactarius akahatsu]